MSVLLINRDLSTLEYYHTAITLYDDMLDLFSRNFGVKYKVKPVITEQNKQRVLKSYPYMDKVFRRLDELEAEHVAAWLIGYYRSCLLRQLEEMLNNITDAYHAPDKKSHEEFKRAAISNCEKLVQILQRVMRKLPVDVNKLLPYVDKIDFEITLLENW